MSKIIIKNTTNEDIEFSFGDKVDANSQYDFSYIPLHYFNKAADLKALLATGDVVLNDGISDLSPALALNYLSGLIIQAEEMQINNLQTTAVTASSLTTSAINGMSWPSGDGNEGQAFKTDGAGNIYFANVMTYITHGEDEAWEETNSTSFLPKLSLSLTGLKPGKYKISWHYAWAYGSKSSDFIAQILWDDDPQQIIHYHQEEPAAGTTSPNTDQSYPSSGWDIVDVSVEGNYSIDLYWKSDAANVDAAIGKARLLVERFL